MEKKREESGRKESGVSQKGGRKRGGRKGVGGQKVGGQKGGRKKVERKKVERSEREKKIHLCLLVITCDYIILYKHTHARTSLSARNASCELKETSTSYIALVKFL